MFHNFYKLLLIQPLKCSPLARKIKMNPLAKSQRDKLMTSHVLISSTFVLMKLVDGHFFPRNGTVNDFSGFDEGFVWNALFTVDIKWTFFLRAPG